MKSMKLKTKRTLMYTGVAVCAVGMILLFIPGLPAWCAAALVAIGAVLVLGCAYLSSCHVYQEGEEVPEKEVSYQSLGMASGMCLGAAVSFLFFDNVAIGMPVGMVVGFLIGSLIRKK